MVLGLRSKNRRPSCVQIDYTLHIQEIKPWPPSQSLKSLKSVVLQWENGDRSSGSTAAVAPSQSKIEVNESFNFHATLVKESSRKGNGYQKNVLELSLYEPRRDKTVKGQLLGNAVVDLAEIGVIKDAVSFGVPLNCKRSYRNTAQPVIYVKIQQFDNKESSSASSSFRESLSREESVSALMSEEYEEEAEIASFTDDEDVSSQSSSLGNLVSASPEQQKKEPDAENENKERNDLRPDPVPLAQAEKVTTVPVAVATDIHQDASLSQSLPEEVSIDAESSDSGDNFLSTSPVHESDVSKAHSSPSSGSSKSAEEHDLCQEVEEKVAGSTGKEDALEESRRPVEEKVACSMGEEDAPEESRRPVEEKAAGSMGEGDVPGESQRPTASSNQNEMLKLESTTKSELSTHNKRSSESKDTYDGGKDTDDADEISVEKITREKQKENGIEEKFEAIENPQMEIKSSADSSAENGSVAPDESLEHSPVVRHRYLQNALRKPVNSDTNLSGQRFIGEKGSRSSTSDRVKNKELSMRSPPHSLGSVGSLRHATADKYVEDVKEIDVAEDLPNAGGKAFTQNGRDDQERINVKKHTPRFNTNNVPNNKVRELELRVEMLEGELREAAAVEVGLYSIVAEHGSSMHKVHTPARRLSRFYIHASKQWSRERKVSAARSIISGLVSAAKACGNDVPRLTFWLSNSIVLRAIVTGAAENSGNVSSHFISNCSGVVAEGKSSPLKWESLHRKKEMFSPNKEFDECKDLSTFTVALERIESWIFSRVIESIWWQTFTPRMQSTIDIGEPKTASYKKKNFARTASLGNKKKENFSTEIWIKAFSDACERLCPVRAEGHGCGCLPILARLVMEQCVARLDVAMFNAILRESADEIPTDPVSDPISDPKVLLIPPGKLSFGAGAQLKNAIGNWSRWLTDLFGMDTDEFAQDKIDQDDGRLDVVETFKSFLLLNALSDLLMLPKDLLLDKSIRKEVCPTFSTSVIKRILESFSPDEFCPDAIPDEVLEALDTEEQVETNEQEIRVWPCNASPISYLAPSVASIENIIGDARTTSVLRRSGSSVARKCHTSDDELDALDSPLTSIMLENPFLPAASSKGKDNANVVRYQLLRDVWRNDD